MSSDKKLNILTKLIFLILNFAFCIISIVSMLYTPRVSFSTSSFWMAAAYLFVQTTLIMISGVYLYDFANWCARKILATLDRYDAGENTCP